MAMEWKDNPVFLTHKNKNVSVYHIFKNDHNDSGTRQFWFGMTPDSSDNNDDLGEFDVRELTTWKNDDSHHGIKSAAWNAIEIGELAAWED